MRFEDLSEHQQRMIVDIVGSMGGRRDRVPLKTLKASASVRAAANDYGTRKRALDKKTMGILEKALKAAQKDAKALMAVFKPSHVAFWKKVTSDLGLEFDSDDYEYAYNSSTSEVEIYEKEG